jgi:hypothetical protein
MFAFFWIICFLRKRCAVGSCFPCSLAFGSHLSAPCLTHCSTAVHGPRSLANASLGGKADWGTGLQEQIAAPATCPFIAAAIRSRFD